MTNVMTTTNAADELTMSSREIGNLMGTRHDNVKRTIERLESKGIITFTPVEEKSSGGRPGIALYINQRASYIVVAQLSPEFTARLVDRWQELEAQVVQAPALPGDYLSALKALVSSEEQKRVVTTQRDSAVKTIGQSNHALHIVASTFGEMSRIDQFY